MSDIGPTDFLFCDQCDRHVGTRFYLEYIAVEVDPLSAEDRSNRVMPRILIRSRPRCSRCSEQLVQKYVSVTIEIEEKKC